MLEQTQQAEKIVVLTLAKGNLAELRHLVEKCLDRDDARVIYMEVCQIAKKLRDRHEFGKDRERAGK